ncbi:MAG: methyltransferase domain-containing protein [Prolixibacteraceae bacterium]|nr:methyltransferase domain-containing protein [Prolixibacteraceae bacterium]
MSVQVNKTHYLFDRYVDKKRWASYYSQISEVVEVSPQKVLVVGVGDGIIVEILKMQGIEVLTMDFDAALNPDFELDVRNINEISTHFDVIICCQVLEHLPFGDFEQTLDKLMDKTSRLVLSLPIQHSRPFSFFKFQRAFSKNISFSVPRFNKKFQFDGEHHWEMNTKGYLKSKISGLINKKHLILKSYIQPDNVYHFYYILEHKK